MEIQAMTHDELAQFAAGKVGVKLKTVQALQGGIDYTKSSIDGPDVLVVHGIDLSSPDLMLKGMGKVPDYILWDISGDKGDRYINFVGQRKGDTNAVRFWQKAEEIPLLFWQCWAEVEGGQG